MALNGVEFDSPISSDAIFYGQIEQVNILDAGSEFDIINAPQVSVADTVGSGAVVHGNFEGKIEGIVLTNLGFNYIETPSVTFLVEMEHHLYVKQEWEDLLIHHHLQILM